MVSIILVNYNTRQLTDDCIKSIIDNTKTTDYEIILVDNASTDGSKEFFQKDSRLSKYIWLDENVGFGRANNEGIIIAKGEYLFLLNTDTILLNDAIDCFLRAAASLSTNCFMMGGWLVDRNGQDTASFGEFNTINAELKRALQVYSFRIFRKEESRSNNKSNLFTPVDLVIGADMFLTRSVVDMVGVFDPAFFMYCEEMDWQYRMSKVGIPRYIINTPKIVHLVGGSQGVSDKHKNMNRTIRITKSMFIYFRKYNKGVVLLLFKFLYFILRLMPIMFVKDYSASEKLAYYKILITEK